MKVELILGGSMAVRGFMRAYSGAPIGTEIGLTVIAAHSPDSGEARKFMILDCQEVRIALSLAEAEMLAFLNEVIGHAVEKAGGASGPFYLLKESIESALERAEEREPAAGRETKH